MRIASNTPLNFATASACAAHNRACAEEWRSEIDGQSGGLQGYRNALHVRSLRDGDSSGLAAFYSVLEAGILPSELVPITDFSDILRERNDNAMMAKALGPYRYFCLAMLDASGETIGVSASIVFMHREGVPSLHTSYLAIVPARRGFGFGSLLLDATVKAAVSFLSKHSQSLADPADLMLHFIETNAMANMTLHERLLDEAMAMHPLNRDAYWQRQGFREIEGIAYQQRADPPIALALNARCYRILGVDNYEIVPADTVPAGTLLAHVRAFDNLLLNYDEATTRLLNGQRLAEPQNEGLLGPFDADAPLPLMSGSAADMNRACWKVVDADMAKRSGLPMDIPLREVAGVCLGMAD